MRVDLNSHSTWSDGVLAPSEVVEIAIEDGVKVFALTDDNTVIGYAEAARAAKDRIKVLKGVKASTDYKGRYIQLLIYGQGDADWSEIVRRFAQLAEKRRGVLRDMAALLAARGIEIDVEAIIENAGTRLVGRDDIAQALVGLGVVKSAGQAMDTYFRKGGPLDLPPPRIPLADLLPLACRSGAVTSLAHPQIYGRRLVEELCSEFRSQLSAIEAYHAEYDEYESQDWDKLAAKFGLAVTGGCEMRRRAEVHRMGVEIPDERLASLP